MTVATRKLYLIMGKGGVGRSTVAAALALKLAKQGKKTLLYQSNAKDKMGELFGGKAVGTNIVQLAPNLYSVNPTPETAIREYGIMVLRFERIYKMVFENAMVRSFLRATPGLYDYSILGKGWYHTKGDKRDQKWDVIVFDMPASGHCLSMLSIPKVIIKAVPDGPLSKDARAIQALLENSEKTRPIVVTLAEEMPVRESAELQTNLKNKVGLEVKHFVVNKVMPAGFAGEIPLEYSSLVAMNKMQNARHEIHLKYAQQVAELGSPHHLPQLFCEKFSKTELELLASQIDDSLL